MIKISPPRFLMFVSVICTVAGMLPSLMTARILGPEGFGLIAILAGFSGVVANFFDVRLTDMVARLFHRKDTDLSPEEGRGLAICFGLVGTLLISGATFVVSTVATMAFAQFFTRSDVPLSWIFLYNGALFFNALGGYFFFSQRFSERFYAMGVCRLVSQAVNVGFFAVWLFFAPDLNGYFGALTGSAIIYAVGMAGGLIWLFGHRCGNGLEVPDCVAFRSLAIFRSNVRTLFYFSSIGYLKMAHRGGDVLLVGFFCDQHATGLYKLARSLTDALYTLYDGANQYYYPHFLGLLADRKFADFREGAVRIVKYTAAVTIVLLIGEVVALDPVLGLLFSDRFIGAKPMVIALTLPFFYVVGIHLWAWPLIVSKNWLRSFTFLSVIAAVIQYTVAGSLFFIAGSQPLMGGIGYAAYYVPLILLCGYYFMMLPKKRRGAI